MNESFFCFYKNKLKRAIKSVQVWIKIIVIFIAYIFLFNQSGEPSIFAYVYNIGMVVAVFVLVNVIFTYISWAIKNNKTKKIIK